MANGDLGIYQGDDWAAMVTVKNADGTDADLTGYTAQSQIRTGPADQVWEISAEITCAVVPPNQISLSLTSAQTGQLEQPNYCWDLQITSPANIITTILAGNVTVQPEVTRFWTPGDLGDEGEPQLVMGLIRRGKAAQAR
jgi:hypothetical protein